MNQPSIDLSSVVGIGASAGGLHAIEALFKPLTGPSSNAFVVVQHVSPDFKSLMGELVARVTNVPVVSAEDGMWLEPNSIYIPPPGTRVLLRSGRFSIEPVETELRSLARIDQFFESLALSYGPKAIAVVLSGSGSDGSKGVVCIREHGGCVICQDTETSEFASMPQSAIHTGCVDVITAPAKMAEFLENYHKKCTEFEKNEQTHANDPRQELLRVLQSHLGVDFSHYKDPTVTRRISRRFVVCGTDDLHEYLQYIRTHPQEIDHLYHDILIGVTRFFRDAEAFKALRAQLKEYLRSKFSGGDLRVWVAGCATGQEAYSFAILLDELKHELKHSASITIYATDAHKGAIDRAAKGVFARHELEGVPENLVQGCFELQLNDLYKIHDRYRRMVLFAHHDLLCDPPFTKMDLVSCRNVLIYLEPHAQDQILSTINYALKEEGILFIGTSEGLAGMSAYFKVCSQKAKTFTKLKAVTRLPHVRGPNRQVRLLHPHSVKMRDLRSVNADKVSHNLVEAYDVLLARHMPPGVLVSAQGEILHYFGDVELFLESLEGRPSNQILDRVSEQIRMVVATLTQRIQRGETRVEYRGIPMPNKSSGNYNLIAEAVHPGQGDTSMIHFVFASNGSTKPEDEQSGDCSVENYRPETESIRRIRDLEQELRITKENLQTTIEELQTVNEALQTTNEEMLVANEELQNTNEELQSVNEELYTVNSEYSQKNEALIALNSEHQAILEGVDTGILFVDSEFRICKFNSAMLDVIRLLPQDIGRPVEHLATNLYETLNLKECIETVVQTGNVYQDEVMTQSGTPFLMQIHPFAHPIDEQRGALLTFSPMAKMHAVNAKLRQSQERLSLAVENAHQGLWETNPRTGAAYYSPSWYQLLGFEEGALKPQLTEWQALVHPEDAADWWRYFDTNIQQDRLFSGEFRIKDARNVWRWVSCRGRVCKRNSAGQPKRVLGLIVDVSNFKQLELDLRETERRLELSLRSADQVWWEWDIPRRKLVAHGSKPCILGYDCLDVDTSEDFWWERIPAEEVQQVKDSLARHFDKTDKTWRCEHRYRDPEGEYRWVINWGQVTERAADGRPLRMFGITQLNDVSKNAEIALEESRALYRSIIEDQDALICRFGPDFAINYVNRAFAEFYDSDCDAMVGMPVLDLLAAEDRAEFQENIAHLTEADATCTTLKNYPVEASRFKWVEWTSRVFYNPKGEVIGYQTIGRDTTLLKESEEQLRKLLAEAEEARNAAETANKAKSEFLAVINHELRTPLNPIIAGSELLAEIVEANEEQYTIATMIHSAGEHLLSLINSVLDLSKLEAGKVTPVLTAISPAEIIDRVTQFFIPLAQQKSIDFKISISNNLPETIVSDSFIIRQILINIIGNAFKFTRQGSIQVSAYFAENVEDQTKGVFQISIADTGIGISAEMQEKIFDPFSQADIGVSREFGGTGIGLAISRQSAQLLGGGIRLRSKLGKGSEFSLLVPVKVVLSETISRLPVDKKSSFEHLDGAKVMVVDDDPLNRETIRSLVVDYVDEIHSASGGKDAIQQAQAEYYDVVLMDVHMPEMDGFQTAQAIKQELKEKAPKIIFVTADNRQSINRQAMEQYYGSGFLSKPLRGKLLLETMNRVMGARGRMGAHSEIDYLTD